MNNLNEGRVVDTPGADNFSTVVLGQLSAESTALELAQADSAYFPSHISFPEEELNTEISLAFRVFEFTSTLLLAAIVAPLCLFVSLLLKLQSNGSVLYRQVRVGKHGKEFSILKFRTMFEDAESTGPFVCTSYDDDRITPLGQILRKTKIDELPQLWNILKGEMALVGPRPERPCFHEENLRIRDWEKRIYVRPGLTGLAQISQVIAHDPEKKIVADMAYIRSRSLILDLQIIVLTAFPDIKVFELCSIPLRRR